eukprot:CAMPEP_0204331334 /NCGR_PEP_ID=MMETSP0469-20131031/15617_1 /ASSEMBLY_ACC=CAM_ASM_000384 /TAXON_ID=2969 /ORGANISM="Oxyrrhis marina" /LENGTH=353 /DNA_ID=CAMNT_0051314309 /DNA_START=24 /DNA_END=1085 /DNA_ORIENTATION=+
MGPAQEAPKVVQGAVPDARVSFPKLCIRLTTGITYQGELTPEEARLWVRRCPEEDMRALASTERVEWRKPLEAAMLYVGEQEATWDAARKSLQQGATFLEELCRFDLAHVTRGNLQRMKAVGSSVAGVGMEVLEPGAYTALALAAFVSVVIQRSEQRLTPPEDTTQRPFSLKRPKRIKMVELEDAIQEALQQRRTPLIVCNRKEEAVATYLSYQFMTTLDAKQVLMMSIDKEEGALEKAQAFLRKKLVSALKFGKPLYIRMATTALDFSGSFCVEDQFPSTLFNRELWGAPASYKGILSEADFDRACCFGEDHYVLISTDFELDKVMEYLHPALPHLGDMAVIDIDPSSVDSS